MKETLSALLDGECTPSELDRLLSELERDPALREHFSRQCLARESRLGTRIRSANLDFSAGVLAALQSEEPPVVVALGDRVRRLPWRMAASLAAAAAVGALAVLVVRPDASPMSQGVPIAQTTATEPVTEGAAAEPVQTQFAELDDENARQLRNYVIAYSQSRGQQGVGSTLGYARYAAYTDDRPTARTAENQR